MKNWVVLVSLTVVPLIAGTQPSLIDAVKSGDHAAIKALLQKKADVNATEPDGSTALHWASYRDDVETANLLIRAGAKIMSTGPDVFAQAEMIVKVKEPLAEERKRLKRGQILFTYLHLAPDLEQTRDLMASGATCIAYETVTSPYGGLPLLTPMSEVAGRLAPHRARQFLFDRCGRAYPAADGGFAR